MRIPSSVGADPLSACEVKKPDSEWLKSDDGVSASRNVYCWVLENSGLYYTGKQYSHGPAPLSDSPYQAKRFESKQSADAELSSLGIVYGGNWDGLVPVEHCFLEVSISD